MHPSMHCVHCIAAAFTPVYSWLVTTVETLCNHYYCQCNAMAMANAMQWQWQWQCKGRVECKSGRPPASTRFWRGGQEVMWGAFMPCTHPSILLCSVEYVRTCHQYGSNCTTLLPKGTFTLISSA